MRIQIIRKELIVLISKTLSDGPAQQRFEEAQSWSSLSRLPIARQGNGIGAMPIPHLEECQIYSDEPLDLS